MRERAACGLAWRASLLLFAAFPGSAPAHACDETPGETRLGWVGEPPSRGDYDEILTRPAFMLSLNTAKRMDKIGNACEIAAGWLSSDGNCAKLEAICNGNDHESFRVYDPWRSDEFVDVPCRVLVEACVASDGDRASLQRTCADSLASITGYVDDDPGPLSFLLTFACGLAFYGAAGTGCHASGADHPTVPIWLGGGSLCQFGAGTFLGAFACSAISVFVPF
jgi:hypothetical protein